MHQFIRSVARCVTDHNRLVIVLFLVLTAGVVAGVTQLEAGQDGAIDDFDTDSEIANAQAYLETHYEHTSSDDDTAPASVYVRADNGNVLGKEALLAALEYQRTVYEDPAVADALTGEVVHGPPNLVGMALADDPNADLDAQTAAIERATDAEVARTVETVLDDEAAAQAFMPSSYAPGGHQATSMRLVFEFSAADTNAQGMPVPSSSVQAALAEVAAAQESPTFFTLGEPAQQTYVDQQLLDTAWLILPAALLLVLGVLAFAYRDVVDVLVGFTGVLVSVAWLFGLLGWLGIPAGMTMIIGPVLIVSLSIDFGLHVFMRYREARGPDDGIRSAMRRSTASVSVAFLLVTVTAGIGFLSNLTNPLSIIAELGIGITLGVVSAFVVFTTFVPALKVSIDGILERGGLDRRKAPLGSGRFLRPVLNAGVTAARVAAPVVIVVALLAGAAGGAMLTGVDAQGFQNDYEIAEWQEQLPGPMGWEAHETDFRQQQEYVQRHYQAETDAERVTRFLIQGEVTDPVALERVAAGTEAAGETDFVFSQGDAVPLRSPLSVMDAVAAEDPSFAETLEAADTSGDGVPDRNVEAVYDALFAADAERASQVLERTPEGQYRSFVMIVPVEQTPDPGARGEAMHGLADTIAGESGLTVTPVGTATVQNAEMTALAEGILQTMVIALGAVLVTLAAVFRLQYDSAVLGAVTVVPVALVLGLVFGGMYLLDVPLTLLTALLVSITIGLGIDYSIHVSDRFAQELERGRDTVEALGRAVTGTGGALLGSALTSSAAVGTLILHPHPQFESFGLIVVLALSLSFLVSVFVLPSLLYLWAERSRPQPAVDAGATPAAD